MALQRTMTISVFDGDQADEINVTDVDGIIQLRVGARGKILRLDPTEAGELIDALQDLL